MQRWIADLARRIGREGAVNVTAAVNVAQDGGSTRARRRQRVVQRDGTTTVTTESDVDPKEHDDEPGP